MSIDQRNMLFAMLARIARAEGVKQEELRPQLTAAEFGAARSWAAFGDAEVDRMKAALKQRMDELNLDAIIEGEQYHAHDAAQAAHVPAKGRRQPRRFAGRYERMTDVDDPGERRRAVYWISRLFSPPYIRRVVGDLFATTEWEALTMPRLLHLKDTLKNRLGKWLTKHKEKHDFGFSIASRNPRSRTRLMTNEALIGELLARGICLDLHEVEAATEADDNCPF